MTLAKEDRNAIVALRLKKAGATLVEAMDNVPLGHWRVVANSLYYACFYAANALLVQKGIAAHTHAGVKNQLGLHFVKEGLLGAEQHDLYGKLFELRQTGDYDDLTELQEKDVVHLVEPARKFVMEAEKIIRLSNGKPFEIPAPRRMSIKNAHGIFKDLRGMDTSIERDEEDRI